MPNLIPTNLSYEMDDLVIVDMPADAYVAIPDFDAMTDKEIIACVPDAEEADRDISILEDLWLSEHEPAFRHGYILGNVDLEANAFINTCLTLCISEKCEASYLTLNEGGVDMRWELIDAFLTAGYYPPRSLWHLPEVGRENTKGARRIVAVCNYLIDKGIKELQESKDSNNSVLTKVQYENNNRKFR